MARESDEIYRSSIDPEDWGPDREVGGLVHVLYEEPDGRTVGLWKADPMEAPRPAGPVELPLRESILVLAGSVRIGVNEEPSFELKTGEMVSLPRGSRVAWSPSPDCKVFWVYA